MPSNDVQLQRAFDGAAYRSYQRSRIPARLGNGDGSTLYVSDDNNNQIFGKVWARLDGENAPRAVEMGSSMVAYDMQVIIFVDSQGNYKIEGKQVAAGNAYIQNDPNGLPFVGDVAPHAATHGRFAPDPIIVESPQFFPLAVRPTQNPSLSVRVEKGWYYVDGEEYPWAGGIIDLTDYVPSGADEQVPVIVAINSVTNEIAVYEGTTITSTSIGVPFTPSDVAAITVGDAVIRLAAVRLKNGMTGIGLIDIFEDLRPFYMAGSSGTGGGFANTALSNLTSPTAINQHLLPASDGGANIGNITKRVGIVNTMGLTMSTAAEVTIASGVATLSVSPTVRIIIRAETGTADTLTNIERGAGGTPTDGLFLLLSAYTGHTITVDDGSGVTGIVVDRAFTFGENDVVIAYYDENVDKWKFLAPNAAVIPASQVISGTFADVRIAQSNVTQHQAALSIAASQVTAGTFGAGNYETDGTLLIDGAADAVQLTVQANATQTALLSVWENSAGTDQITFSGTGGAVFNEAGNDVDFRIESDTRTNAFTLDGTDGHIGIGLSPSSTILVNAFESITGGGQTGINLSMNVIPTGTINGTTGIDASISLRGAQSFNSVNRAMSASINVDTTSGGTFNNLQGGLFSVSGTVGITGTVSNVSGIRGITNAGDLTVTLAIGSDFTGAGTNNGVVTTSIAHRITQNSITGTGSITTQYGLQVGDMTVASTNYAIETNAGLVVFNQGGNANADFRVEGDTDANLLNTDASTETVAVGVAAGSHLARLHVDQLSTTFAKPVLALDQADVSEEFIRFIGTSANGVLTQSIVEEADVTTATRAGWLKVYVQDDGNQLTDQAYFLPVYTLA